MHNIKQLLYARKKEILTGIGIGLFILIATLVSAFQDINCFNIPRSIKLISVYGILYSVLATILIVCRSIFRLDRLSSHYKVLSGVLAFLYSLFITVGNSFYYTNTFYLCFGTTKNLIIWLFQMISYVIPIYLILTLIVVLITRYRCEKCNYHIPTLVLFCVFLFSKLIPFFIYYPAIFDFDAAISLRTFLNPLDIKCNHHPYFIQIVQASFFKLGSHLGNPALGMALLSIVFILDSE